MSDDDDYIVGESQMDIPVKTCTSLFTDYVPFLTNLKKNKVTSNYSKIMRDVLLNKQNEQKAKINTNYTKTMRNILLNTSKTNDTEDQENMSEDLINESQIDVENDIDNQYGNKDNILSIDANNETDEEIYSQKKEVINGHVLRKRNANQYHIYQVDKLNYNKITELMLSARYVGEEDINTQQQINQSDDDFDFYDDYDEYDDIDDSSIDLERISQEDNSVDSFSNIGDIAEDTDLSTKSSLLISSAKAENIVLEDSGESQWSSDEEEPYVYKKPKLKLSLNKKKNLDSKIKNKLLSDWGPLKHFIKKKPEENLITNLDGGTESEADFMEDFKPKSNVTSKKQYTAYRKTTVKSGTNDHFSSNYDSKQVSNLKTNHKSKNLRSSIQDPPMLLKKKRRHKFSNQKIDSYFQSHMEINAAKENENEFYSLDDSEIKLNKPRVVQIKDLIFQDQESTRSIENIENTHIYKFLTLKTNKSIFSNLSSLNFSFSMFFNNLLDFSVDNIFDYEQFLIFLLQQKYDINLILDQLETLIIKVRDLLAIKSSENFKTIFHRSGFIPLLCFQAILLNANNNNKKNTIINKMIFFIVRFINNIMKVNGTAEACLNEQTKHMLTFIITQHPDEFKKIIQYYSTKSGKYKKLFYEMFFVDLEINVDSNDISLLDSSIDDKYLKNILILKTLLSKNIKNDNDGTRIKKFLINFQFLYEPFKEELLHEENYICSLKQFLKQDEKINSTNTYLLFIKVLLKYKHFFEFNDDLNSQLVNSLLPKSISEDEEKRIILRKINMCVVLSYLNYKNFSIILPSLIPALENFSFQKTNLIKFYKNVDIETLIYKDCFDHCILLFISRKNFKTLESTFFYSLKNIWIDFYNYKWNLLGEALVDKSTVGLFKEFISKIYKYEPEMTLIHIQEILKQSINIDDHKSLIYKYCISIVLKNTSVDISWIKIQIYDKLFMFFKSCDSIRTYMNVIERLLSQYQIEIFDFNRFKLFFRKSDSLLALDYYLEMSSININKNHNFKITGHIFKFMKKCLLKWFLKPDLFYDKEKLSYSNINYKKFIKLIKNYLLITQNLVIFTDSVPATVTSFLQECSFKDFKELILEIDTLPTSNNHMLVSVFSNCNLTYEKRFDQIYLNILLKYKIKDKTKMLNQLIDEFNSTKDTYQFIAKISQNDVGFSDFIDYLLNNDMSSFSKVYNYITIPQVRYKVDLKLIKYLKERCLQLDINQWNIITELATTNSSLMKFKKILINGTKKKNEPY
ncbi:hypothetical protein QEN19_000617 [Hanseniaspora menglaensis]